MAIIWSMDDGLLVRLKHKKENSMTKEEKLKAWVARDKFFGDLSIYTVAKPERKRSFWSNAGNKGASHMFIDKELFAELRWEDEPIEVELIIRRVKE